MYTFAVYHVFLYLLFLAFYMQRPTVDWFLFWSLFMSGLWHQRSEAKHWVDCAGRRWRPWILNHVEHADKFISSGQSHEYLMFLGSSLLYLKHIQFNCLPFAANKITPIFIIIIFEVILYMNIIFIDFEGYLFILDNLMISWWARVFTNCI